MSAIPLQRSKALLQEQGWKVWKVEQYNSWARTKTDLFGLMDLVAIRADVNGVLGIQCCSGDVTSHLKKYLEGWTDIRTGKVWGPNEFLPIWKAAGNKLLIHSWTKCGDRGKRKVWTLREVSL